MNTTPLALVTLMLLSISSLPCRDGLAKCNDDFAKLLHGVLPETGSNARIKGFESEEVRLLGHGEVGGHVYLVRPRDGAQPFVIKIYDAQGSEFGRAMLANDRIALQILAQALEPQAALTGFRPLRILGQLDPRTLKLEYVAGRDLESAVQGATPDHRLRLHRLYTRRLQAVRRSLTEGTRFEIEGSTYQVTRSQTMGREDTWQMLEVRLRNLDPDQAPREIRVRIKADNLLIGPDGHFIIIDPH